MVGRTPRLLREFRLNAARLRRADPLRRVDYVRRVDSFRLNAIRHRRADPLRRIDCVRHVDYIHRTTCFRIDYAAFDKAKFSSTKSR
jgi:hypothetical protein